ncbi:MAG: tRNA pseudouridine(55) synthase TruB [Candidatus Falkowbacteria bacterium]
MPNIFAVHKPKGPTSNQILTEIKRIIRPRQKLSPSYSKTVLAGKYLGGRYAKVGHAGTLDPLAEGVLIVAIGREGTRQLDKIVQKEKEYIADVKLGMTSTTDDEEGIKLKVQSQKVQSQKIKEILPKFIGKIKQVPPIYSAIKINGQEAYKRTRKGEDVKMKTREVEIKKIEILKYKWPNLQIRVVTGSGVYIRALARDIGAELSVGGYLAGLIRTRVGDFKIENAVKFEDLKRYLHNRII